ncbi:MAG: FecR domain-containing protein [Fidelibacterota bacterium]
MKKFFTLRNLIFTIIAIHFLLPTNPLNAQNRLNVALTLKVRGDSRLKRAGTDRYLPGVKRGTSLYNKDWLKTGDDGYLALVFLDDKSMLKMRENSELEIAGKKEKDSISKMISMQFGKLKAEISEQRKGDFTIATPTSVASVKGTEFWIISNPILGDIIIGLTGQVDVTNRESGQKFTVKSGQTGNSKPDGTTTVETTQAGTVPTEPEEEEMKNELEIQFENQDGETKTFKIVF